MVSGQMRSLWAGLEWVGRRGDSASGATNSLEPAESPGVCPGGVYWKQMTLSEWNLRAIARHVVGGWIRRVREDRSRGRSGPEPGGGSSQTS